MKKTGWWNPPPTNYRINTALNIFYRLSKKRDVIIPPMGGDVTYKYLSETEISSYFLNNPNAGFGDKDWLLRLIYKADEVYVSTVNKRPKKPSK